MADIGKQNHTDLMVDVSLHWDDFNIFLSIKVDQGSNIFSHK